MPMFQPVLQQEPNGAAYYVLKTISVPPGGLLQVSDNTDHSQPGPGTTPIQLIDEETLCMQPSSLHIDQAWWARTFGEECPTLWQAFLDGPVRVFSHGACVALGLLPAQAKPHRPYQIRLKPEAPSGPYYTVISAVTPQQAHSTAVMPWEDRSQPGPGTQPIQFLDEQGGFAVRPLVVHVDQAWWAHTFGANMEVGWQQFVDSNVRVFTTTSAIFLGLLTPPVARANALGLPLPHSAGPTAAQEPAGSPGGSRQRRTVKKPRR